MPSEPPLDVLPGASVGPIRLGMTYGEVKRLVGEGETAAASRLGFVRYGRLGLELVVTTMVPSEVTEAARVIAIGVLRARGYTGLILPDMTAKDVERALGAAPERAGPYVYYPAGIGGQLSPEGRVIAISIFAPYTSRSTPPPMEEESP